MEGQSRYPLQKLEDYIIPRGLLYNAFSTYKRGPTKDYSKIYNKDGGSGLEQLINHFATCNTKRFNGGCLRCKRMWQLLRLHSLICIQFMQSSFVQVVDRMEHLVLEQEKQYPSGVYIEMHFFGAILDNIGS
ncbi:uncharacterized protein LOC133782794 isoform X2 [Humulus lupulus]|uniref:uncharacterized protein LOC133782794 isoform X2 n=1 Tax=Humulus lupulus TaxID=3486 RepID=UPI002B416E5A|nr:uncharacterized protein LOC133782794 isoform X2 [Humulus lupulus]